MKFSDDVAEKAVADLDKHDGRPNPSTLAFITKRLYEEKRDDEAKVFQDLQCVGTIAAKNVTHMIFALSGNDPAQDLAGAPKSKHKGISRENAAIIIGDHGAFVTAVYKTHGAIRRLPASWRRSRRQRFATLGVQPIPAKPQTILAA
jgi:hypothetical protein